MKIPIVFNRVSRFSRKIALMLSFSLLAPELLAQTATVQTDKPSYEPGQGFVVAFAGGPANAKDWIGLYKADQTPGGPASTSFLYVDGTASGSAGVAEGSVTFASGLAEEGDWVAYFLENDGYNVLGSASFSVIRTTPYLTASTTTYYTNQPITLTFGSGPGNPKDWVAIYKQGETPGGPAATLWYYVDGTRAGASSLAVGEVTFGEGLTAGGSYVAYFLGNDTYEILASLPISVLASPLPSVLPGRSAYFPDEPITVSFANGPGNPRDWVGVYFDGQIPGDETSTRWAYVSGTQTAGTGLEQGSVTLPGLPFAGDYNAFFLLNDGYSILASNRFSVVDPSATVVRLNKRVFFTGDDIVAEFINGPGNPKDWLGIYATDEVPDGDPASIRYLYVDGTGAGNQALTTGSVVFNGGLSQPGDYAIHLLENDGYAVLATETFRVVNPVGSGIRIVAQTPASEATNTPPILSLQVALTNDFSALNPQSVTLRLDGVNVTPIVTTNANGALIEYNSTTLPAPGSTHAFVLTFADNASPAAQMTREINFGIGEYRNIELPAAIYFNNFDSIPEGQLPEGWTEQNFTHVDNEEIDFEDLNSAAYKTWTSVNADRFEGSFVTYSNPDNPQAWEDDFRRVLAPNPFNVLDGVVYNQPLASGRFLIASSGYRNGPGQIAYLFTPDFDLSGKTNVHAAFKSLWEQNQDSVASLEYSVDQGQSWLPVLYMLDEPDIVRVDSQIDVDATFNTVRGDIATSTDPETGEPLGGTYGSFIAAPVDSSLAPFVSARVDDNPVESKRIEIFRLPEADDRASVRFRFAHAGADSWYWGIDDFGLYSIESGERPELRVSKGTGQVTISWDAAISGFTLQAATSLGASDWQPVGDVANNSINLPSTTGARFFRLMK
jgi:hypothetical protein